MLILTNILACASVIILRESRIQNYQPRFRTPLYPWMQIAGIVGFLFLILEMGKEAHLISLILFITGLGVYWFYGKIRTNREYALLHLIERITAKELTTHSLEAELREIIRERDEIEKDRFDHLIEKCLILDIEQRIQLKDFFKRVADVMAPRLNIDSDTLSKLLQRRERESSTVLTAHLAIPHIVIKGQQTFDILLARCKKGVIFSDEYPDIHAVFVVFGTKDERNFHLFSLSAIAQIIQAPDFEKKWMNAKSKEVLRDIVLLGKRKRR